MQQELSKDFGGIASPGLYQVARNGTKCLIEKYHNEVIRCIQYVFYYQGVKLTNQAKLEFFSMTRHTYGRTALMFSGGGGFGKFHFGIIKALYEQDLLPRIIVGSSVGSAVATLLCIMEYDSIETLTQFDFAFQNQMIGFVAGCESYTDIA